MRLTRMEKEIIKKVIDKQVETFEPLDLLKSSFLQKSFEDESQLNRLNYQVYAQAIDKFLVTIKKEQFALRRTLGIFNKEETWKAQDHH